MTTMRTPLPRFFHIHTLVKHRWYPHRELVESISPNAISPYAWGSYRTGYMIYVPIWHNRSAAYYIHKFRLLAGYQA